MRLQKLNIFEGELDVQKSDIYSWNGEIIGANLLLSFCFSEYLFQAVNNVFGRKRNEENFKIISIEILIPTNS